MHYNNNCYGDKLLCHKFAGLVTHLDDSEIPLSQRGVIIIWIGVIYPFA